MAVGYGSEIVETPVVKLGKPTAYWAEPFAPAPVIALY